MDDEGRDVAESPPLTRDAVLRRGAALGAIGLGALLSPTDSLAKALDVNGAKSTDLDLLTWFTYNADIGLAFKHIRAAYMKQHPDVAIKQQTAPFETWVAAVSTRYRANKLGDVLTVLPGLNHVTIFPTLQHFSAKDFGNLYSQLTIWDLARDRGSLYGVPIGVQGPIWYYNKALFKKAGLDPEKAPKTWKEFAAACTALRNAGIDPIAVSGKDALTAWFMWTQWTAQFFPQYAQSAKLATGNLKVTDIRMKKSLSYVAETYKQGWWSTGFQEKTVGDVEADFGAGRVAMIAGVIAGFVNWTIWDKKLGKSAYGVFSAPLVPDRVPTKKPVSAVSSSFNLAVNAKSRNRDAALAYIKFVASPVGQRYLLIDGGQIPNRKDLDVFKITRSRGAAAVRDILAKNQFSSGPQLYFKPATSGKAFAKLITSIVKDDLDGFLKDLEAQQHI